MVRYPAPGMTPSTPGEDWPRLPGVIECQCGPGEWTLTVCEPALAQLEDGTPAPPARTSAGVSVVSVIASPGTAILAGQLHARSIPRRRAGP